MSMQSSRAQIAAPPWRDLPHPPKIVVYIVGFVPAVWWFWLGVTDRLGADPMRALEHALGLWALRFLIFTLAITPLRQLAGINLLRYRRALGLSAFYYALMHLTTYLVLDQGLDFDAIGADILKRPYITIGMTCFIVLLPLAVTSNHSAPRRQGVAAPAPLRLSRGDPSGAAFLDVREILADRARHLRAHHYVLLAHRLVRSLRHANFATRPRAVAAKQGNIP